MKAPKSSNSEDADDQKYRGILATSPTEFLNASTSVTGDDARFSENFLMTNNGLRINTGLGRDPGGNCMLSLNCSLHGDPTKQIGIYLKLHGAGVYAREQPHKFVLQEQWQLGKAATIFISKRLTPSLSASLDKRIPAHDNQV